MKRSVKYFVMDVDGTLTDGKIYMGNDGEVLKAFCVKDGYGIHELLMPCGIVPIIITGRESKIVENRCRELEITEIHQGIKEKTAKLTEILERLDSQEFEKYGYKSVAYIGDDRNDLSIMTKIQEAGGVLGCPADAAKEIIDMADFVSGKNGGDGAVREFIEWLMK